MTEVIQRLPCSKWDCKYHVVVVPKRRRQELFGHKLHQLGLLFRELARQKECEIIEGHLMPDHMYMCIMISQQHL